MTFTNRLGQDMFIKLSSEDEPKILRATDTRVSFVYRESGGTDKLQVSRVHNPSISKHLFVFIIFLLSGQYARPSGSSKSSIYVSCLACYA